MNQESFQVIHDLSLLSPEQIRDYLAKVSQFIGLPPELNGLDTIWMRNENSPGQSLVVYARRGTAEILRNLLGIEITDLQDHMVKGSIVFRAVGKNAKGRQEIATGSKYVESLTGKVLDDAIMTASTRALRRVTMQFTSLGILDESEVVSIVGQEVNPAGSAQLAGSPTVVPPLPTVPVNNTPGEMKPVSQDPKTQAQVAAVIAIRELEKSASGDNPESQRAATSDIKAAINPAPVTQEAPASPAISTTSTVSEAAKNPAPEADTKKTTRKPRKKANTVVLDVEPETVQKVSETASAPQQTPFQAPIETQEQFEARQQALRNAAVAHLKAESGPTQANPAVPTQANPVPAAPVALIVGDVPTEAQMTEYRKKISIYTAQLPASEGMGSVQKMRAFITRMSEGTPPQSMTVPQWDLMMRFFDDFMSRNSIANLVKYINDSLGVK